MAWARLKNEQRNNPRESLARESKMSKTETGQDGNGRLGKMSHRRMEEHGKKLRRKNCGKTGRWRGLVVRQHT
jgi:hypothetical protein